MKSSIRNDRTGKLFLIILLPAFLFMSACSGGGGDISVNIPTPAGTPVSLTTVKGFFYGTAAPGSQMSFNLSGSDSTGQAWTGSFAMASDGPTTFETNNVYKERVLTSLTRTADGASASGVSTSYFLVSDSSLYKSVSSSGTTAVPTAQTLLPDNVRVGDSGSLQTTSRSDNAIETATWKLEGEFNFNSKFTFSFIVRDATTNVVKTLEDDTLYLDSAGKPYKVTMTVVTNSVQLTMAGNRNP